MKANPRSASSADMGEIPSRAREYFERFTAANAAEMLQALARSETKTYEDEQLDFKHGNPREQDIDQIWSKALGAFANSQGGVVVWGIRADRDNHKKLDFAHSLALVPDIHRLKDRLTQKYRFLTDPPLANVEVVPVPLKKGAKDGFVVCYVPEGDRKAFQSTKAKFPYYFRIGSDAAEISNGWLRQLFYPRVQYKLSLHIGALKTFPTLMRLEGKELAFGGVSDCCIEVGIWNEGEYSVYEAAILVKRGKTSLISWKWEPLKPKEGWGRFEEGAIRLASPLHPTLRSTVKLCAVGNDKATKWSISVFAKDMKPFHVELEHADLPIETGEPLVVPLRE
jgi:hypothetical protein